MHKGANHILGPSRKDGKTGRVQGPDVHWRRRRELSLPRCSPPCASDHSGLRSHRRYGCCLDLHQTHAQASHLLPIELTLSIAGRKLEVGRVAQLRTAHGLGCSPTLRCSSACMAATTWNAQHPSRGAFLVHRRFLLSARVHVFGLWPRGRIRHGQEPLLRLRVSTRDVRSHRAGFRSTVT